ncbi:M1 family metallopeptidase [Aggregatimonas sangjinii]|uniref:M1 family metallopeptidase n=1 Tax=Aggregatimonas sangjinii TaxID=2583587 RepID=A0A5B7SUX7_9FLAO|nr:M1 family metallopeptidase [Aggregatimonas sangjinii]
MQEIYFNDWANAYSSKNTGLAKRFAEDFRRSLHLAKKKERGYTKIMSAVDSNYEGLRYKRTKDKDIIRIQLNEPLAPNESTKVFLTYTVKLPPDKFTSFGYDNKNGYYLKDWYLTPAIFDGEWQLYSNKNLEDLYTGLTNTTLNFTFPEGTYLASNFKSTQIVTTPQGQQTQLVGKNRKSCEIILSPEKKFITHVTDAISVTSDIEASRYDKISQGLSIFKITEFIADNLGKYPHDHLLVSEIDYAKSPLYGLNQLPSFIRPYEDKFQFEMKFFKTALRSILAESLYLNPRKEQWLNDAIANYLMIAYVEQHYPDQKLLGKLSKIWGIRSFNLAKMGFNEQYPFLYNLTARTNKDQPLTESNDSLIKFNQKVANKYKAGQGLSYLASYIGKDKVDSSIKTFYRFFKTQRTTTQDFKSILKRSSDVNIDWFFDTYVSTDRKIDFKIKEVEKLVDSLRVTIKNKEETDVPISLFGLKNDSVVSKYWFTGVDEISTFTIPRNGEEKLVLNYDQKIPEFNQRDNWKSLGGFLSGNKKLKFTFFRDSENPYYNQVFYVPIVNFNIYDGWTPGLRFYNKTLLQRPFVYDIAPAYSFREKALVGSGRISYIKYLSKSGLYVANYSLRGSTSHFNVNSRYSTVTPSISFGWRPKYLRSNNRQSLLFRYVNIFRDLDEGVIAAGDAPETPDYSVFNIRYRNVDNNILDYKSMLVDFQQADKFTKLSLELEYRKLFESNRQFNLRVYAGKFLRNKSDSDFFSFALDRPTDYLFDYGYLGRSEGSGIYSQQIIIAEGGFKSILDERYRFSNDWLATMNTSVNLWKWIEVYGDLGYVKNKNLPGKFVYDSGIRLNLVTDYFELYLPFYSNNGWEIAQPDYGEKIRFVVTVDLKTLVGLFTRDWF